MLRIVRISLILCTITLATVWTWVPLAAQVPRGGDVSRILATQSPDAKSSGTNPPAAKSPAGQAPATKHAGDTVPAVAPGATLPTAQDAGAPPLPTEAMLQQRRTEIQADAGLAEPDKAELLSLVDSIQQKIQETEQLSQRLATLKQGARDAADAIAQAKEKLQAAQTDNGPQLDFFGSADELQAAKLQSDQAVSEASAAREAMEAAISSREERLLSLPKLLSEAREEQKEAQQATVVASQADAVPLKTTLTQWDHDAHLALLHQQLAVYQQEKTTFELERPLMDARVKLAIIHEKNVERRAREISQRFADDRLIKARQQIDHFESMLTPTSTPDSLLIDTIEISKLWQGMIVGHSECDAKISAVSGQYDLLSKDFESVSSQVKKELESDRGLSSAMGLTLQQKRSSLPNVAANRRQLAETNSDISKIRTVLTSIGMLRELVMRRLAQDAPNGSQHALHQEIDKLLTAIDRDANEYHSQLLTLSIRQQEYIKLVDQYKTMIDGHVLWFRSADRFGWSDIPIAWRAFQGLVYPPNLRGVLSALQRLAMENVLLPVVWLGCIGLLVFTGPRLRRRLVRLGNQANRSTSTSMQITWSAMLTTLILSLLFPLLFVIPGWQLAHADDVTVYAQSFGTGLLFAAMFVAPLELIRQVFREGGLGISHFGWSQHAAEVLRVHLRWYIDLGLPLIFGWALLIYSGNTRWESSLGRLVFVAFMAETSWFVYGVMHPKTGVFSLWLCQHRDGWIDRLSALWHGALVALPLLLAGLSLAGYSYSACQLTDQLYKTLILVVALIFAGGVLSRWALLNRRAMVLQQLRERADASKQETHERSPIEINEHPALDIREANEQTMRLIAAILAAAGICGLFWIWTSVLPAIEYLDRFTLIPAANKDGDPFTLADIVVLGPLIAITYVAVRNLPGLLETTLLQRLPLDNAARYAIKTLSSYVMLFAGIMVSARAIGIHWESIQWLVAALGVGLGFGLQEIFANFISGIILLFEQPLRVGDIVTLGDTTGVVSRIRMRATTVTNWDRQELIIPNKDLITGRLVNWTLTDSTNRLVVNVGVAYGTDTERACGILQQICVDHPNIVADPPPNITFEGFGDSTLDLVVRCFLASIETRLLTIHQLHTAIHNQFNSAGIEISFPQRDLHLRTYPPELLNMGQGQRSPT